MKLKLLFASIILLVMTSSSSFAQTKKTVATKSAKPVDPKVKKMNGIGPFKIGQSITAIIDSVCKETGRKLTLPSSNPMSHDAVSVTGHYTDCDEVVIPASMVPDVKTFFLKNYDLASVYNCSNVLLRSYKDTLYFAILEGWPDDLISDLIEKYGRGNDITTTRTVKCDGIEREIYKRGAYWENNDIRLEAYAIIEPGTNCKPEITRRIVLYNTKLDKKIDEEGERLYNECMQAQKNSDLEKL